MKTLGFTNSKTGNEFIPSDINNTFNHFLRGLSDGDGCLYLLNSISSRKHNTYKTYLNWELTCASEAFLNNIKDEITKHIGQNKLTIAKRCGTKIPVFRLRCNSHYDTIKLCEFMYENSTIKLDRKYDVYFNNKT